MSAYSASRTCSVTMMTMMLAYGVSSAEAVTLTVAGVAVKADGERVAGVTLSLYCTTMPNRGELTTDVTSDRGVFSLVAANLLGTPGPFYLVCDDPGYAATPLRIELRETGDDIRKVKSADFVLLTMTGERNTPAEAISLLAALAESSAVRVQAGKIKAEDADRQLQSSFATVLARTRDEHEVFAAWNPAVTDDFLNRLRRRWPAHLPQPKVLDRKVFQNLPKGLRD